MPEIPETAKAPRYKIAVKFTAMYKTNQKIAMIKLTVLLYRWLKNWGMVEILFFK